MKNDWTLKAKDGALLLHDADELPGLGLGETSRLHQGLARYVGSSGISGEPGHVMPTF